MNKKSIICLVCKGPDFPLLGLVFYEIDVIEKLLHLHAHLILAFYKTITPHSFHKEHKFKICALSFPLSPTIIEKVSCLLGVLEL